jgi:hypothetical protein
MAAPLVAVEVEFSAGVWTDVTDYWDAGRPVTITAGRGSERDRVEPGRMSGLWLDNTDGRFTVGNPSSPYWPGVRSGVRIRLRVVLDGDEPPTDAGAYNAVRGYDDDGGYDEAGGPEVSRFLGRVDGWPLSWSDNAETCWVSVSAVDVLGDWATAKMPASWMVSNIPALGPAVYWPLADPDDAGAFPPLSAAVTTPTVGWASLAGALTPESDATPALTGDGLPGDPSPLPEFEPTTVLSAALTPVMTSATWCLALWLKCSARPEDTIGWYAASVVRYTGLGSAGADRVIARVKSNGQLYGTHGSAGGVLSDLVASGRHVCHGEWHPVLVSVSSDGADARLRVQSDGVDVTSSAQSVFTLLGVPGDSLRLEVGPLQGAVGHVAWWTATPFPTLAQWAAIAQGLPKQAPADRIAELAEAAGLPAPAAVGDARATIEATTPVGSPLDLSRVVEDTDGGVLWADGAGTVTYLGSRRRTSGATLALSVTPDDIEDLTMAADLGHVVNEARVVNVRPAWWATPRQITQQITETAATSVALVGARPVEIVTASADLAHLATRAAEVLTTSEAPRVTALPIDAAALSAEDQAALLAAGMWDQVAVVDLPAAGGVDSTWLGRIEGWTESLGIDTWRIDLSLSWAGNRLDDPTHARLGTMRLG